MSSAVHPLSPKSEAAMTQAHDPFAILSDLEISLVLSYLSIEETILIRRVSSLWKMCVDFRLSKGAIGRHFPGTDEAEAVYPSWKEEALAFQRLARFYGTLANPNIARRFYREPHGSWCICNHHMAWVDDTHVNIQRLWDPNDPTRERFPVLRRDLNIHVEGKPWNYKYLSARWLAGDDTSGTILLYLGVPATSEKPTHSRWLVALSVVTRTVLWHHKHDAWIREPDQLVNNSSYRYYPPISFGHGKICFVETGYSPMNNGKLVIANLATGNIEACETMPDDHYTLASTSINHRGIRFAAHPTKNVYFLLMAEMLWVFSTKTAKLLERYTVPGIQQNASNCQFQFGRNIDGAGEQTWLLCVSDNSIVGHMIEPENFQITWKKVWSFKESDSCVGMIPQDVRRQNQWVDAPIYLDPIKNFAYILDRWWNWENPVNIVLVRFESMPSAPERTLEAPDYCIKSYKHVTLPPKKIEAKKRRKKTEASESSAGTPEDVLPNGRRVFTLAQTPLRRFFWGNSLYLAIDSEPSGSWVYVFGRVPRL